MFWYSWYSELSLFCCEISLFSRCFLYSAVSLFLFSCGFSLFYRDFSLFSRRFLYSAAASLFCRGFSLFCRGFSLFCRGFFILPWVFFILPWLCLCCCDFNYITVVLLFLPWQLWATVNINFNIQVPIT